MENTQTIKSVQKLASTADSMLRSIKHFNCAIYINNKRLTDYDTVMLEQGFNQIPSFSIQTSFNHVSDVKIEGVEEVNALIGKPITLRFYQGLTLEDKSNDFAGIITDVEIVQQTLHRAILHIKGQAPCHLLQSSGKQNRIYQEQDLVYIAKDILNSYSGSVSINANPVTTHTHALVSQYEQTDFEFLNWLSFLCGEWFYWDRNSLCIGRPEKDEKPITLSFDNNLIEQRFLHSLQATAHQTLHSYFPTEHRIDKLKNWPKPEASTYGSYAENHINKANQWLNMVNNKQTVPINALYQEEIGYYQQTLQAIAANHAHTLQGKTNECLLRPGIPITLASLVSNKEGLTEQKTAGSYLVQSVKHHYDNHNKLYNNEFVAIPNTPAAFPHDAQHIQTPKAHSQIAEVISNPDQYGRVKVRMQWNTDDRYSPYLYAVQPELGTGSKGKKRGFYFLPRQGDSVVVDALHGNPNFLYISGAISHGKNMDAENNANNNIRWITTDSGHTLVFNDNEAEQGITIYDKNNNKIHIDTQGNNIAINAIETIQLNAKNIVMNATENISSSAGMNINQNAGMNKITSVGMMMNTTVGTDMQLNVTGKLTEFISGDVHSQTKKERIEVSESKIVHKSNKNTEIHSQTEIHHNSAEKSKLY